MLNNVQCVSARAVQESLQTEMTRWDNTEPSWGQRKHRQSQEENTCFQFSRAVTGLLHYLSAYFPITIVLVDQLDVCRTTAFK